MRLTFLIAAAVCAYAQSPLETLWKDLEAKRRALPGLHQEFEVTRTYTLRTGTQEHNSRLYLDMAGDRWREAHIGWGGDTHVFTGKELLVIDEAAGEFTRNTKPKREETIPDLYNVSGFDWRKAEEAERRPCGFGGADHACIILNIPYKATAKLAGGNIARTVSGDMRLMLDLDTGAIVAAHSARLMDNGSTQYIDQQIYKGKVIDFSASIASSTFSLPPSDPREVKKFSEWGAVQIRKKLLGKPAPDLSLTDMNGNPLNLDDLLGKTVLLDFWASWCPPCRADAPDLEKLQSKYGDREMVIVGINMDESRETIQAFLKEHPAHFATAMTLDNDLPRVYRVGSIPTYIVVDPKGNISAAESGDQGFGSLRKMLKKAGLDVE